MDLATDGVRQLDLKSQNDLDSIKLRSYQQEMFEASVKRNIVVVMPTGSGKTPVAIQRMKYVLEETKCSKLIWFLAGGVTLCRQQFKAFEEAAPYAKSRIIVGEDNPDTWGSQEAWDELLCGVQVMFSTFDILRNALSHAHVRMESLGLLIFDEAHHINKSHPGNMIMKKYHELKAEGKGKSLPAILGLTASPAENGKLKSLKDVEANLDAICKTPRLHRLDLQHYVNVPKYERLVYLQEEDYPFTLTRLAKRSMLDLSMVFEQLLELDEKVSHIVKELGWWAAVSFIRRILAALDKRASYGDGNNLSDDRLMLGLRAVLPGLEAIHAKAAALQQTKRHYTTKVRQLIGQLHRLTTRTGQDKSKSEAFMGILFVRRRIVAALLSQLLEEDQDLSNRVLPGSFVGCAGLIAHRAEIHELVIPQSQVEVLRSFREGDINLIVSTDVLDEGIDVVACNSVICFDPPQNLRSFVQKRGRARQKSSSFTIMAERDDPKACAQVFKRLELEIEKEVQRDRRTASLASQMELEEEEVEDVCCSTETGACITATEARGHLENFCNKLPKHPYTNMRPQFHCELGVNGLLKGFVQLPTSVPVPIRTATSRKCWKTEKAAIRDAAVQAYKGLYFFKLLNENLLPVETGPQFQDDFQEQQKGFHHLEGQVDVWTDKGRHQMFRTIISIYDVRAGCQYSDLVLYTYVDLSGLENFELLDETDSLLEVQLSESRFLDYGIDLELLASCTEALNLTIRTSLYINLGTDLCFFLAPDLPFGQLSRWLSDNAGVSPATDYHKQNQMDASKLIVAKSEDWSSKASVSWITEEDGTLTIECVRFSKRRNFLKTKGRVANQSKAAIDDMDVIVLDAETCLVRRLSIEYAHTMRFMPSIIHHLELMLAARKLQREVLVDFDFKGLEDVARSITSPFTTLQANYERNEFLGDSVLKLIVSRHLFCEYPYWHEGYLTKKRKQYIANISLAKATVAKRLDRYILTEPFAAKHWKVPSIRENEQRAGRPRHLRTKIIADVAEALIGAAFTGGGVQSAERLVVYLFPDLSEGATLPKTLTTNGCDSHFTQRAEHVIGRPFRHKHLLMEALTHPSLQANENTEPYQRLEFLGDAVLEYIVVTETFRLLPQSPQSSMSRIKAALVNADFLAFLCHSASTTEKFVDWGVHGKQLLQDHRHLSQLLRCDGREIGLVRGETFERFLLMKDKVDLVLRKGQEYPWEELCELKAPKFVSDMIESLLGAIFVDSNGEVAACMKFLERIELLQYLHRIVECRVDLRHPREKLQHLLYGRKIVETWEGSFDLEISVDDVRLASVKDCFSKDMARVKAANIACRTLTSMKSPVEPFRKHVT